LPAELLEEARALLQFRSKTDTIIFALRELVRRRRIDDLKALMGSVNLHVDSAASRRRTRTPDEHVQTRKRRKHYLSPLADLDLDGSVDFAAHRYVFLGRGDGTFDQSPLAQDPMAVMAITDMDGDEIPDLLALSSWLTGPLFPPPPDPEPPGPPMRCNHPTSAIMVSWNAPPSRCPTDASIDSG